MPRGWDGSWALNIADNYPLFLSPVLNLAKDGGQVPEGRMRGYWEMNREAGLSRTFRLFT